MLHVSFSNRFELLLEDLLAQLDEKGPDPFSAQQIIVPSTAIGRKIELTIADRYGICANVEFAYLGQWLWQQIALIVDVERDSPFAPEVLAWRVYERLGDATFTDRHARLKSYIAGADAVMRLDLARRIAQLIEHYITYRPQFLAAWSAKKRAPIEGLDATGREDEIWQAALWRRLSSEIGAASEHPSVTFFRKIAAMDHAALAAAGLPESAHVFCLPSLPPLYLDMLRQLSRVTRVQLYVLNPCQEYWFEVVDRKRLGWLAAKGKAEHHEVGNALLAAWGKQTQAHIDLLYTDEEEIEETGSVFAAADRATLLGQIQDAILVLEDLQPGSVALAEDDRSLEVHVCHSLTRELEVLHDQLLALFAGPNPPKPQEILVVTPQLDDAAPLIDAVFGTAPPGRYIPYAITGQPQRRVNPIARALCDVVALTAGRHPASEVFDLLMQAPVAARFGLQEPDLEAIRLWIEQAGIRWALEGEERKSFGLPASEHHSFADGLQRLYLAYAMGESTACVDGRIGAGNPEGQSALALGAFWRFVEELRRLRRDWRRPKNAPGWREALGGALERFAADTIEWAEDFRAVRKAIAELQDHMERGGLTEPVPLEVIQSALGELLDDPARGGVPSGRVTFSSISSLRNLPYRIVCAVGLDDGKFPTAARALEFDLMALAPQHGDRQRRTDERNLFLDLLLAARERLYLSYTGRSVRDNSSKPPSVLVAELLDYAVRACSADVAGEVEIRKRLVVEHPLQPFSPDYFAPGTDPKKRSFNAEYCEALRAQASAPRAPEPLPGDGDDEDAPDPGLPFFRAPLGAPEPEWRVVRLEQLRQFFVNPCRYLLKQRLGIAMPELAEELLCDEPFLPEWPGRQAMAERLLAPALEGAPEAALLALARAGNEFPAGPLGDAALASEIRELRAFARGLQEDIGGAAPEPHAAALEFEIEGETWRLEGAVGELRAGRLVRSRYDDVRAADYLSGWIAHLFLCATLKSVAVTRWHSRDGVYALQPYAEARERLAELMALYREGLRAPLHFFPKSAWAYVTSDGDLGKAKGRWQHWKNPAFGESADPAYRLALRGVTDPLDARFVELAERILLPLRRHVTDPRL
ncbi:MAG: exodeoxyribonuclease V subunit gamma [Betaproteobacteria bacterium]|nr:MAG: exodeoxyribonuclease V subunit gamma [Betaproteobacteria bacterium]